METSTTQSTAKQAASAQGIQSIQPGVGAESGGTTFAGAAGRASTAAMTFDFKLA